jgi:hypothetical protein
MLQDEKRGTHGLSHKTAKERPALGKSRVTKRDRGFCMRDSNLLTFTHFPTSTFSYGGQVTVMAGDRIVDSY